MHYADGTEVKMGDLARSTTREGATDNIEIVGFVVGGYPESETCNVVLLPLAYRKVTPFGTSQWKQGVCALMQEWSCTAKELLKVASGL